MNTVIEGSTLTFTGPLEVRITLADPETGKALYVGEPVTLRPGESLTWDYPEHGIVWMLS